MEYYQFDTRKLKEYKALLLTKNGINEIINIIHFNERKLYAGRFDFKQMVATVHKRVELLNEEETNKFLSEIILDDTYLNLKSN